MQVYYRLQELGKLYPVAGNKAGPLQRDLAFFNLLVCPERVWSDLYNNMYRKP